MTFSVYFLLSTTIPYSRAGQLDQFRELHIMRQQSARAMKVPDMNNSIWRICDSN
jgi:hypothetical protein